MTAPVKIAFDGSAVVLPLKALLPLKTVPNELKRTVKYRRIAQSVAEIGVIEPLVVAKAKNDSERYLLLDGHMRRAVLLDAGETAVQCIVADDDEAFTYNKRVNRLATIQEHLMIVRAIARGVSEERLARALNVDVKQIQRRRILLEGICPELIELMKDKSVNPGTFEVLRKMKPMRQIEVGDLMATAGNFTASYAKALLAATRQSDLVRPDRPKALRGLSAEQMARMEREMEALQRDLRSVEATYGDDVLHLVIATSYLARLTRNRGVERFLAEHHPEILSEFRSIIATVSLDQSEASG